MIIQKQKELGDLVQVENNKIKVEMIKHPTDEDWLFCKQCALNTIGKNSTTLPSDEWKIKILKAEHSPIRTLWFAFKMNIPYFVSVHLTRHHIGAEHFVQSQRDDRADNNIPRAEKPQGEMVSHIMYINAQELMFMARRRLCNQASVETRQIMKMIVDEVLETNPEFKSVLVPMCKYQNRCPEMYPCSKNYMAKHVKVDEDNIK